MDKLKKVIYIVLAILLETFFITSPIMCALNGAGILELFRNKYIFFGLISRHSYADYRLVGGIAIGLVSGLVIGFVSYKLSPADNPFVGKYIQLGAGILYVLVGIFIGFFFGIGYSIFGVGVIGFVFGLVSGFVLGVPLGQIMCCSLSVSLNFSFGLGLGLSLWFSFFFFLGFSF